jgi:hypothetical protein
MKIELDLPEIEGYEYTGEYRIVEADDYYLEATNEAVFQPTNCGKTRGYYPILKKKAPKYKLLSHKQSIKDDDVIEYVEIKALEDALKLMHGRTLNVDDMRIYDELKSLIS